MRNFQPSAHQQLAHGPRRSAGGRRALCGIATILKAQVRLPVPLVTVVVPTCAAGRSAKLALQQIAQQTIENLEVLIVDDTPGRDQSHSPRGRRRRPAQPSRLAIHDQSTASAPSARWRRAPRRATSSCTGTTTTCTRPTGSKSRWRRSPRESPTSPRRVVPSRCRRACSTRSRTAAPSWARSRTAARWSTSSSSPTSASARNSTSPTAPPRRATPTRSSRASRRCTSATRATATAAVSCAHPLLPPSLPHVAVDKRHRSDPHSSGSGLGSGSSLFPGWSTFGAAGKGPAFVTPHCSRRTRRPEEATAASARARSRQPPPGGHARGDRIPGDAPVLPRAGRRPAAPPTAVSGPRRARAGGDGSVAAAGVVVGRRRLRGRVARDMWRGPLATDPGACAADVRPEQVRTPEPHQTPLAGRRRRRWSRRPRRRRAAAVQPASAQEATTRSQRRWSHKATMGDCCRVFGAGRRARATISRRPRCRERARATRRATRYTRRRGSLEHVNVPGAAVRQCRRRPRRHGRYHQEETMARARGTRRRLGVAEDRRAAAPRTGRAVAAAVGRSPTVVVRTAARKKYALELAAPPTRTGGGLDSPAEFCGAAVRTLGRGAVEDP